MFGLQMFDVEMYECIKSHRLTVDEAIELKRAGKLPESLKAAWEEYARKLDDWKKEQP